MENLTPPVLTAVREIRWRLSAGKSMKESLKSYLSDDGSRFAAKLREWAALHAQGHKMAQIEVAFPSHYQRALLLLIDRGLAGQPVLPALSELELEIEAAAQAEIEEHLQTLPFKVLIPLLLFQFPAFLLLLLGPLLRDLSHQLGGG